MNLVRRASLAWCPAGRHPVDRRRARATPRPRSPAGNSCLHQGAATEFVAHLDAPVSEALQLRSITLARALHDPGGKQGRLRGPEGIVSPQPAVALQRLDGAHVAELRRALQPALREFGMAAGSRADFACQHKRGGALAGLGRGCQQARARVASGATPTPFRYMRPNRYCASALPLMSLRMRTALSNWSERNAACAAERVSLRVACRGRVGGV